MKTTTINSKFTDRDQYRIECPDGHALIALPMRYPLKGVKMLSTGETLIEELPVRHIFLIIAALRICLSISWYASVYVNCI